MSFFNSKEEVINIELTQKGKYLLSRGKFNPKYYEFFDDDILYDSEYAGILEKQNDSQERILNETAYSKPQANFSSVQDRNNELNDITLKNGSKFINEIGISLNNFLYSIGKSSYNSNYLPSWNINLLKGEISSSADNIEAQEGEDTTYTFIKVPQINLEPGKFQLYAMDKESIEMLPPDNQLYVEMSEEDNFNIISSEVNMTNIIDVQEKNTVFEDSSFKIEFFIERDGKWHQLNFFKDLKNIKDDILLDDYINKEVASTFPDENSVEYYFDVQLDSKVDLPLKEQQSLSSIYSSPVTEQFKPFGDDC